MAIVNATFSQSNDTTLKQESKSFNFDFSMGLSDSFDSETVPALSNVKYGDNLVLGSLPKNCIITRCYVIIDSDFTGGDTLEVGIVSTYPHVVEDTWETGIDLTIGDSMRNVSLIGGTKTNADSSVDETDPYKGAGKWVNQHPIYLSINGGVVGNDVPMGSLRIVVEALSYYPKG